MTCIIGLAVDGETFIGGDSCGTIDDELCLIANGKIFERGAYRFGCSGSRRFDEIVRYNFEPPQLTGSEDVETLDRLMASNFAEALRTLLNESGIVTNDAGVETFAGTMIVGVSGRLYFVSGTFSVTPILDGFWATGSGTRFALGSLQTTAYLKLSPRWRIELALKAAAHYANGVRPPFRIIPVES